ncbi:MULTISPECIES: cytochrome P450 [Acidiplasma]|uniref:Cytochrome n=2 Tax=Acidiplasma TaxID=507753 RepID=A0A0Q0RLQ7_9ARCH|nr:MULTISPECIES: cytochrome P450 [Acidiplasma]KJE49516.1 cytochrome P450 [Acidiplasma sp. MBA-1]KQB35439.1 cytochrome [Acidiplasma aeolicum]KQB36553.1 cytochrome [Acidiplasma cupricumulans]WMT54831.1 MAG: cytochrome P450 [Acidiplasma sp.]
MNMPTYRDEPFKWYEFMRQNHPVFRYGNSVHVFKYNDILNVLSNHRVFSSQFRDLLDENLSGILNEKIAPSILILDPPKHTELRNLINYAFVPKTIDNYENRIRQIADDLIINMLTEKNVDIVAKLSYPLPVMVISEILGIPDNDMPLFKIWSDRLASSLGRGPDIKTQYEIADYFYGLIRKPDKLKGLLKDLCTVEIDGRKLTDQEIVSFAILLLVAGNETTTNLITNTILTISENKKYFYEMQNDASLIPAVIEETLRYRSPVQSTRRYAREDTEISGTEVLKNDIVFLYLGSANRDEDIYKEPDLFDPKRNNKRHMAFGHGIHFCIGAPLARLEAVVVLKEFSKFIKDFTVEKPSGDDRIDSDIMYGFKKLIINL